MSCFADSSAVVKLYADEEGGEVVGGRGGLYVSDLCLVEVAAAFWAMHRDGRVTAATANVLFDGLRAELAWAGTDARFARIGLTAGILGRAAQLARIHLLRANDAIQLASALAARDVDPACSTFLCFDRRLRLAGEAEGFRVLPVELPAARGRARPRRGAPVDQP